MNENSSSPSEANSPPLCVDMDGTLLQSDTMEEMLISFLREHPWQFWRIFTWWLRGRPFLKRKLGEVADLRVSSLPGHPAFVAFLREQKAAGRTLVLASAADENVVARVAARFGLFAKIVGSDGKINLKSEAKLKLLTDLYGARGFDYAGNSSADLPVWRGVREAIVVNARPSVERRARKVAKVSMVFPQLGLRSKEFKILIGSWRWPVNLLLLASLAIPPYHHTGLAYLHLVLGITSFCLADSSINLSWNLCDLGAERSHSTWNHPLAAGHFSILAALILCPLLALLAFGFAAVVSKLFLAVLVGYYVGGVRRIKNPVAREIVQLTLIILRLLAGYAALKGI